MSTYNDTTYNFDRPIYMTDFFLLSCDVMMHTIGYVIYKI